MQSDVYASARNRFFQMVQSRQQRNSIGSHGDFSPVRNLSLLHCFEEAYMAKNASKFSPSTLQDAEEICEKMSVASLRSLDFPDVSTHVNISTAAGYDLQTHHQVFEDSQPSEIYNEVWPDSPSSFENEYNPNSLVNYPITPYNYSEVDLTEQNQLAMPESRPKCPRKTEIAAKSNQNDCPSLPERIETGLVDDKVLRNEQNFEHSENIMASSNPRRSCESKKSGGGAGDRPRISSKPKSRQIERIETDKRASELLQSKIQSILANEFKLRDVSKKSNSKLMANTASRSRLGKYIKSQNQAKFGKISQNFRLSAKRAKVAPLGSKFEPVDAKVVPVWSISSTKRENPKFKIVKHFRFKCLLKHLSFLYHNFCFCLHFSRIFVYKS